MGITRARQRLVHVERLAHCWLPQPPVWLQHSSSTQCCALLHTQQPSTLKDTTYLKSHQRDRLNPCSSLALHSKLLLGCFQTASRLLPGCFQAASRLLPDCFQTASRLLPHSRLLLKQPACRVVGNVNPGQMDKSEPFMCRFQRPRSAQKN